MKYIKRYNVRLGAWEMGYYVKTRFYIINTSKE